MSNRAHTVTPLYAQSILQALARQGLQLPEALLDRLPQDARVPLAVQDELWEALCGHSDDPLVGLRVGLQIQVGHLDAVGMLLVTCDTMGEALQQLTEYAPLVGAGGDFELREAGGLARISFRPHLAVRQAERVEAAMACLLNLTRWATGGAFQPTALELAHEPLAAPETYAGLTGCLVQFGQAGNCLLFDAKQLNLPQIQANGTVREHLRRLADQTLSELGHDSFSAAVMRQVRLQPRWGKERVAEALGLSGRHLNRRLAEQGLSFKSLRESLLQQLACQALEQGRRPAEIAEELGFSDEGAFTRAFRRWQGQSPARYRDALSAEPAAQSR
jgi:AraC-like DNA-binding protein